MLAARQHQRRFAHGFQIRRTRLEAMRIPTLANEIIDLHPLAAHLTRQIRHQRMQGRDPQGRRHARR